MDVSKFKYLLEKRALYLRRADILQDKFEGTFSRYEIDDINKWLKSKGHEQVADDEATYRRDIRQQTYISSWCIGKADLNLMWKAYITEPYGVAIKSTVRRLQSVCDKAVDFWPLDLSLITYYDQAGGEHIISYDRLSHFCYKDNHFILDNEIRVLHWPSTFPPRPDNVDIPIAVEDLITSVVMAPRSDNTQMLEIKSMMDSYGFGSIPLEPSRDDRATAE